MKDIFVVEQKPFLAILSSMQPICTKRTTLDATSLLLFQLNAKELIIKSTDLEISLQASYILKENNLTQQSYSFLVSGKRIFELVKELEGDIVCTLTDSSLLLKAGTAHLSLFIKAAEEFPPFPECIENLMQFDAKNLLDMLSKVAFLIPQNNANPALNGLLLEVNQKSCTMTTTDGHCLVQLLTEQYSLEEEKKWLIPRRAIFEIKKLLEGGEDTHIFLGMCNNQLVFSGEAFNFFTKLLVNNFPRYNAIINKDDFIPAHIDRSQFIKTLRRSACLLSGQFIPTQFNFHAEYMRISMHNKEVGTLDEEIPLANFNGESLDVCFFAPYLLNGLQVFNGNNLEFYLKNSTKPIIFQSYDTSYQLIYLVMPVAPTNE